MDWYGIAFGDFQIWLSNPLAVVNKNWTQFTKNKDKTTLLPTSYSMLEEELF